MPESHLTDPAVSAPGVPRDDAHLHCLDGHGVPELRDTTEHMADIVFELDTRVKGDRVENRLAVPKFRGGQALADVIKLELADEVEIDTSRDIA
jgi:KaiC/GvpD/RAD55 family RecA-like ATPase